MIRSENAFCGRADVCLKARVCVCCSNVCTLRRNRNTRRPLAVQADGKRSSGGSGEGDVVKEIDDITEIGNTPETLLTSFLCVPSPAHTHRQSERFGLVRNPYRLSPHIATATILDVKERTRAAAATGTFQ